MNDTKQCKLIFVISDHFISSVPSFGVDKALEGHSIVCEQCCAPPIALSAPNDGTPLHFIIEFSL